MKENNILLGIAILGLIAAVLAMPFYQSQTERSILSVSGNAQIEAMPDKAEIYISVNTEGLRANEVQDSNSAISSGVIDALIGAGLLRENIETSSYNLYEKTEWDLKEQKYVDNGYALSHMLKITTTYVDDTGKLADTAVNAGANAVNSISFGLTKKMEKEARDDAMSKATILAREKAQTLAMASGIKLGKLINVEESNFYYTPFDYPMTRAGAEKLDAQILPQKVTISGSVSMRFEIA